ncbi:MAG: metallophosphoesterase [Clostridia bacterium]|nr:metallophosphoesterase [Clostridia bacterium]
MDITTYILPASLPAPLRIAQVADLHNIPYGTLLRALETKKPDLIAVTGDLVHHFDERERGIAFLQTAARRWPVFMSLGNHETTCAPGERPLLEAEIRDTGAVLLDNDAMRFHHLNIGGVTSSYYLDEEGHIRIGEGPDTVFLQSFAAQPGEKLLLCHHPEYYPSYIHPLPIRLTLAGHAHGGQWRFRGRGVYAPGQGLFPPLTGGLYAHRLLISRGLGNPCGIPRFGNPPELIIVELQPQKAAL